MIHLRFQFKEYTLLFGLFALMLSFQGLTAQAFKSDFTAPGPRFWAGPDYWSNPLQDWQVSDGMLTCLTSGPNRNVHLLTRRIDNPGGGFRMQAVVRLLNPDTTASHANWVGFRIGAKGEFSDYRDDALNGKGLDLGVTTKGIPFIGKPADSISFDQVVLDNLVAGVRLELEAERSGQTYKVILRVYSLQEGSLIAQSGADEISADNLVGGLVLVSHFGHRRGHPDFLMSSVVFKDWEITGNGVNAHPDRSFGPILFSQYTLSRGHLKLTAQLAPVLQTHVRVQLQTRQNGAWETIASAPVDPDARTASFSIPEWNVSLDVPYRLTYHLYGSGGKFKAYHWTGTIRKEPLGADEIVVAGFTGNNDLGFPNNDITTQIKYHDPDVLFFSGDQIYESVGGYGAQRSPLGASMLDYLRKWYLYGWAYRDLMKDRPTIAIPDDHDVYHGNIWGAGGKEIPDSLGQGAKAQDFGGYKMPARWVNMVQRTQTSHLPDPYDPNPVLQGITVYYTDMVYGGVSFAIIEDRKWKSPPSPFLPEADIRNGWPLNRDFNMKENGDAPGAVLLGERQLLFLDNWSADWSYHAEMKMLLSQTIFANVATLPQEAMTGAIIPRLRIMEKGDYAPDDRPVADCDSNGWPQTGRNKAVEVVRKGFAFHLAGDQHLGSTIRYGVDDWNDSGYALCVPSISNYWPRRWYPPNAGVNRQPDDPKYTGEFEDGFGNKMTVYAVSNPLFTGRIPSRLYDRAAGYGIVRLNKERRTIAIECWPRQAAPAAGDSGQYEGWPIVIDQLDNYGRKAAAFLPAVTVEGLIHPVLHIFREDTNERIYSLRLAGSTFQPKVFDADVTYKVRVGDPDRSIWEEKFNVKPGDRALHFSFE